jgi:hypothetical protein
MPRKPEKSNLGWWVKPEETILYKAHKANPYNLPPWTRQSLPSITEVQNKWLNTDKEAAGKTVHLFTQIALSGM